MNDENQQGVSEHGAWIVVTPRQNDVSNVLVTIQPPDFRYRISIDEIRPLVETLGLRCNFGVPLATYWSGQIYINASYVLAGCTNYAVFDPLHVSICLKDEVKRQFAFIVNALKVYLDNERNIDRVVEKCGIYQHPNPAERLPTDNVRVLREILIAYKNLLEEQFYRAYVMLSAHRRTGYVKLPKWLSDVRKLIEKGIRVGYDNNLKIIVPMEFTVERSFKEGALYEAPEEYKIRVEGYLEAEYDSDFRFVSFKVLDGGGDRILHPHAFDSGYDCTGDLPVTSYSCEDLDSVLRLRDDVAEALKTVNLNSLAKDSYHVPEWYSPFYNPEKYGFKKKSLWHDDENGGTCSICGGEWHEEYNTFCADCDRAVCDNCVDHDLSRSLGATICIHCADNYIYCEDCGSAVHRDNVYYCDVCDDALCGDCYRMCVECDTVLCSTHSHYYDGEYYCQSCLDEIKREEEEEVEEHV